MEAQCQVIHKTVIKVFFKRKGLPGCAHFIRPNVYMGKEGAVLCIGINVKPSWVYPLIHYLVTLRETTPEGHKK